MGRVGARQWTFLSDLEANWSKRTSTSKEYTDPDNDPMIPHTLVLKPGLVIYTVYNGYWYWGRPSIDDLWRDLPRRHEGDSARLGPLRAGAPREVECGRSLALPRMEQASGRQAGSEAMIYGA